MGKIFLCCLYERNVPIRESGNGWNRILPRPTNYLQLMAFKAQPYGALTILLIRQRSWSNVAAIIEQNFNAEYGITWSIIEEYVPDYFRDKIEMSTNGITKHEGDCAKWYMRIRAQYQQLSREQLISFWAGILLRLVPIVMGAVLSGTSDN